MGIVTRHLLGLEDKMELGGNKLKRAHIPTLVSYEYFVIFVSYGLLSEKVIFY